MLKFAKPPVQQIASCLFKQTTRCKGHSKWQNIRHTKGAIDAEKSALFRHYAQKIKIATIEGKSTKPSINLKLSQIIEEAKGKSMPLATINGLLEKIETSKAKTQSEIIDFRGPGNAQFVLRLLTDNVRLLRNNLNTIFKKNCCTPSDGKSLTVFHHEGFILTEAEVDLDTATDDAINAGAEDVQEVEEDRKLFKFICEPSYLARVTNQLQNLNYKIVSSDEDFVPKATITVDEKDLDRIDVLCAKLSALEEVVSIYHNIEMPEDEEEESKANAKR